MVYGLRPANATAPLAPTRDTIKVEITGVTQQAAAAAAPTAAPVPAIAAPAAPMPSARSLVIDSRLRGELLACSAPHRDDTPASRMKERLRKHRAHSPGPSVTRIRARAAEPRHHRDPTLARLPRLLTRRARRARLRAPERRADSLESKSARASSGGLLQRVENRTFA